jgi:hypothetical protein
MSLTLHITLRLKNQMEHSLLTHLGRKVKLGLVNFFSQNNAKNTVFLSQFFDWFHKIDEFFIYWKYTFCIEKVLQSINTKLRKFIDIQVFTILIIDCCWDVLPLVHLITQISSPKLHLNFPYSNIYIHLAIILSLINTWLSQFPQNMFQIQ